MEIPQIISRLTTRSSAGFLWAPEGQHPFFKPADQRNILAVSPVAIAACSLLTVIASMFLLASMFENTNAVWPGIKTDGRPVWQQTLIILTILDCRMDCRRCLNHEILFFEQLKLPVFILIGAGVEEILLYTILITAMIALHHGNIAIPDRIDNILRSVIATPLPHRISTPLCETSMTQSLKTYILYGAAFPRISF
ncbi:MAG: hypothetical protein JZU65_04475 [Chlorobium sp.]|jgi:sterol desaturase/sphingolipid hydroxylase (fatty acid hydroxylase superfamily)|nr:hypothetical protein [Chlorobium sp.]